MSEQEYERMRDEIERAAEELLKARESAFAREESRFRAEVATRQARQRKSQLRAQLIASMAALALGITSFYWLLSSLERAKTDHRLGGIRPAASLDAASMVSMQGRIRSLEQQLVAFKANPPIKDGGATLPVGEDFRTELAGLNTRLERLEKSMADDPERALSIPMLRRDFDHLATRFDEFRITAQQEIRDTQASVSQLNNLLLGGAGALILAGVIGVIGFFARRHPQKENGSTSEA